MKFKTEIAKYFALVLYAATFLLAQPTYATLTCPETFQNEPRTSIENNFLETNLFTTSRNLKVYSAHFPFKTTSTLEHEVASLPLGSTWIDMGAGEGNALADGLKINPNISVGLGISYKRPAASVALPPSTDTRFHYLDGDFVENLARDGKLDSYRDKTDLITDVFGPTSYSKNLPELFQLYFNMLKPGGIAVFNFMLERNFDQSERDGTSLRSVPLSLNGVSSNSQHDSNGLIKWLGTIPGIEVVEVAERKGSQGPYWESSVAIKLRKIESNITVPRTLETKSYEASSPPVRKFEIVADKKIKSSQKASQPIADDLQNLTFHTQRLTIKPVLLADAKAAASAWTNAETMKMSGDYLTQQDVAGLLSMGQTNFKQAEQSGSPFINFGLYVDGELVGMSQVATGQENVIYTTRQGTNMQKWASISYHLNPSAWGKGIATEAARRLIQFAFEDLKVDGLHAEAIKTNSGSQAVLKKAGFSVLPYPDPGHVHFYLLKADFLNLQAPLPKAAGQ
jgi:RimJ/RimL family protein N-acetyltransferase/SAM-dependent methyltransferase